MLKIPWRFIYEKGGSQLCLALTHAKSLAQLSPGSRPPRLESLTFPGAAAKDDAPAPCNCSWW